VSVSKSKSGQGMVDISAKDVTRRTATAGGEITLGVEALAALLEDRVPKGNVLEAAKIAGMMAAKETPRILPYCHPLELNKVNIAFEIDRKNSKIAITSEVVCLGRTGVEMEALTAVSAAALTIYDMLKWAGQDMVISDIRLLTKTGGKSGDYRRS